MRDRRFRLGAQVCELLHLDPVVYFTETVPEHNAIRDASATVLAELRAQKAEEEERRRSRSQHQF